jgi:hypothetical protein
LPLLFRQLAARTRHPGTRHFHLRLAPHPTHPFFRASVSAAPASAHVTSVASHRLYLAVHPGHWTNVRHAPYSLTCNEPRENCSHRQSRLDIVIAERGIRAVSRKAAALFATTTIYVNVLCIDLSVLKCACAMPPCAVRGTHMGRRESHRLSW